MRFPTVLLAALAAATPAFAHTGVGVTPGFVHGFLHPIGGLDHVLAMVAVGLLAFRLGGRALWLVPSAFLAMMAGGGALGSSGDAVPLVEIGTALSVVVIGGLVALGRGMPVAVAMTVAGGFAIFHGHAHGAEMPGLAADLSYGLGFLVATGLLHGTGLLAGFGLNKVIHGTRFARASGAAIAVTGVSILVGAL